MFKHFQPSPIQFKTPVVLLNRFFQIKTNNIFIKNTSVIGKRPAKMTRQTFAATGKPKLTTRCFGESAEIARIIERDFDYRRGVGNFVNVENRRTGLFEVTMFETGACGRWWPGWHLGPELPVKVHQMVRGNAPLPIHGGLFKPTYHGGDEAVGRD